MELPVYLFSGFLDAGKTRFIQETLENPDYNDGTPTLLLVCEEGETEYDSDRWASSCVIVQTIENPEELKEKHLERLVRGSRAKRVFVEYNGMWNNQLLFDAMPQSWIIAQEFCFMDSGTILTFNANLRNLVVDKLKTAELVIFNRLPEGADILLYHKLVRGISRRAQIVYEKISGEVEMDTLEDPLPFDLGASVVEIEDRDYAFWYRDLTEELAHYDGKTVRVKGRVVLDERSDGSFFVFGRPIMTCCVEDIQFAGVACQYPDSFSLQNGQWALVTAKIIIGPHEAYGREGPVLQVLQIETACAPEEETATYY